MVFMNWQGSLTEVIKLPPGCSYLSIQCMM